jgi:hypothetical protein
VCRATGAVLWYSEDGGEWGPLPADIDDAERYVAVPGKHDLGLGKPLALGFARTHLPECYEQVCGMFSRRGAYARFKDLLEHHQSLDAWHQWEAEQTRQALREWCADKGLTPGRLIVLANLCRSLSGVSNNHPFAPSPPRLHNSAADHPFHLAEQQHG